MNTRQKSKSEMYQTVGQVCDDEAGIISEITAFQTAVNQFKAIFAQILETEQIRSQPLTGITAGKSADRANLTKTAAAVAGFLSAYASVTKNAALKSDVNFSNSKLLLMREDMLVQTAQNIHDLGTATPPRSKITVSRRQNPPNCKPRLTHSKSRCSNRAPPKTKKRP